MATKIEICPFCNSHRLHVSHHLMTYSVMCETCKCQGPHKRSLSDAVTDWNQASLQLNHARVMEKPLVQGHLSNLEHAVRNLAVALRHAEAKSTEFEH